MDSISLAYAYGWRNSGDLAINQGSIAYLNSLAPAATPRTVSIHPQGATEFRETEAKITYDDLRFEFIGGPMRYNPKAQSRLEKAISLAGDGVRYATDRIGGHIHRSLGTRMAREIRDSDFFFYNGGNLIHHNRSLSYLLGVLYPLQVAKQYDVPYGLLPHTIFDIEGRYHPLILSVLDGSEFIWTRDSRSYEYLTSEFSLSAPVRNGIDTAFFLSDVDAQAVDGSSPPSETGKIAVVPRFSSLGDTEALTDDGVEATLKRSMQRLAEDGYDVNLTVQTKVEQQWARENQQFLDHNGISVFRSFSPKQLRAHYSDVDLLITMRLHAGIFALSVGTPAIGLYREQWGPKTPGTWETLEIDEYALPCEQMTVDGILQLSEEVLDDRVAISNRILRNIDEKREYMIEETRALTDE
jgi:polysaccharide pyruvyl transferase WcaK-like protein